MLPRMMGYPNEPFAGRTLAEVGRDLRAGRTGPVELVEATLAAVEAAQPRYNAFVTVDAEGARAAAVRAAGELAGGTDRGPLHGVPVAVKDIVDTAGLRTTMGSRHFAGHLPAGDATVVARLRAAGAVIVGKTTTHEFAYGPMGDVAANGPCANPHDPARMAGGSSAGSAAAVAAGLVPLAVGTDTGGSVRIPAALCGVAGLRPSPDGIPGAGVFPLSCAREDLPEAPSAIRIGVPTGAWFDRVEPRVAAAVEDAVRRLGGNAREVAVPDAEELYHLYRVVQSAEAVSIHRERLDTAPELFCPETLDRLRLAERVPAWEYARSLRRMHELRAAAVRRLAGVDVLVLPTVPVPAPPLGSRDGVAGWDTTRDALLAFTVPWSTLGLPAVSVPLPGDGLPVGAQLVGLPGGDAELLALAARLD